MDDDDHTKEEHEDDADDDEEQEQTRFQLFRRLGTHFFALMDCYGLDVVLFFLLQDFHLLIQIDDIIFSALIWN